MITSQQIYTIGYAVGSGIENHLHKIFIQTIK